MRHDHGSSHPYLEISRLAREGSGSASSWATEGRNILRALGTPYVNRYPNKCLKTSIDTQLRSHCISSMRFVRNSTNRGESTIRIDCSCLLPGMCSVVSSSGSEHLALVYLRSELRHGAKQDERSFCLEKSRSTAGAPTEVSYQQICHRS